MAFMAIKVRWPLLSSEKLLIRLLLASMTVATCLGDGNQQLDSKSVWDSVIQEFMPAEMKATIQILDTQSEPENLDEMTTIHLLIDEIHNRTKVEKNLNLNSQSSIGDMLNLARLTKNISATESNHKPTELPNMSLGTDPTKKSHIIFSSYTEHPTPKNSTVTYTKTNATDGNPVNASSGLFTVKSPGFYGFIFHALTNDSKNVLPTVELRINGTTAATAAAFNGGTYKSLTLIAGARLKPGDHISIFVVDGPLFHSKKGSKHRASFAGTLMI